MTKIEEEADLANLDFKELGEIRSLMLKLQQHETGMTFIDEKLDKVNDLMKQLEKELSVLVAEQKEEKSDKDSTQDEKK